MARVKRCDPGDGLAPSWRHWCPGCQRMHVINTDPRAQANGHAWLFDNNLDEPTFSPSVNIVGQCHYFVRRGRIIFCGDSRHALAGHTVELPHLEDFGAEIK